MNQLAKNGVVGRVIIAFLIIVALFFVIEILPLHYGDKQIPWERIPAEIGDRLPRILVIAGLASAYIGAAGKRTPGKQQSERQ
jgi:hypothetical protein